MKQHPQFSIRLQCRYFKVSSSGYYAWLKRNPSARQCQQQERDKLIKQAFEQHKCRYGASRIQHYLLHKKGIKINLKAIRNSMKRQGLVARTAKKFKATTDSKHNLPIAPNLLQQDFSADEPNQKWVGDITYLRTSEGWLYLATVIDLFSRRVIGWAMSERMTAQLVCDAMTMALWRRKFPKDVIFHSDRGSQYCSKDFQDLLAEENVISSMSAKGCCYDNACAESFFHSIKVEAIQGEPLLTREQMRQCVFQYIEVDYNRIRLHSSNGYRSPVEFEYLFEQKLAS